MPSQMDSKPPLPLDLGVSVIVPVLEHVFGWPSAKIRALFQTYGLSLQEWERIRTDVVTVGESLSPTSAAAPGIS